MRSIITMCLLAAVGFPAARADDQDAATAVEPAAQIDLEKLHSARHVEAGLAWLAKEQCAKCHSLTIPGHSAAQDLVASALAQVGAPHCTRDEGKTEQATYLGLAVSQLPPPLRKHLQLPAGVGLLVEAVEPDGPAQTAGVVRYDVLEKIDRQLMVNPEQFAALVRTLKGGEVATLWLVHESQPKTVTATLTERNVPPLASGPKGAAFADYDSDGRLDLNVSKGGSLNAYEAQFFNAPVTQALVAAQAPAEELPRTYLGVATSSPPPALAGQLKLAAGAGLLIDSVEPDSPAQAARLAQFDVLTRLDDQVLFNSEQLAALVRNRQPGDTVSLTLLRAGRETTCIATLAQRPAQAAARYTQLLAGEAALRLKKADERVLGEWLQRSASAADPRSGEEAATDDVFLRRLYLDLLGIPPTADELKKFQADTRADKRKAVVDELLGRPEAISRWKNTVSALFTDGEHSLTLTSKDGRERRLTAKDKDGDLVFEGPVETAEQRSTLPEDIAAKLALMFKGLERQGAAAANSPARSATEVLEQAMSVDFAETPLRQVLDTLRERSGGNIVVHWKSLKDAGIDDQAPVTLSLRNVRLSAILSTVLSLAAENGVEPAYTVKDEVILISAPRSRSKTKPATP